MQKRRIRQFINFILLISILAAGMCFDRTETDSFFASDEICARCVVKSPEASLPAEQQLCTIEMLGSARAFYIKQDDSKLQRIQPAANRAFSPAVQTFSASALILADELFLPADQSCGSRCAVRYIHKQDGEKSCRFS